jgi:hypothetical protein
VPFWKDLGFYSKPDQFGQVMTNLDKFRPVWTGLDEFGQVLTSHDQFGKQLYLYDFAIALCETRLANFRPLLTKG